MPQCQSVSDGETGRQAELLQQFCILASHVECGHVIKMSYMTSLHRVPDKKGPLYFSS